MKTGVKKTNEKSQNETVEICLKGSTGVEIKRYRKQAGDREEYASITRKAKAVRRQ
jgi:hypothetical protein